mgnify:CR=1 FL=1
MRFALDWTQVTVGLGTVAVLVVAPAPVSWAQDTAPKPAEEAPRRPESAWSSGPPIRSSSPPTR